MQLLAFDTETGLITDHDGAPPLVCVSVATGDGPPKLMNRKEGFDYMLERLEAAGRGEARIAGANVAFDLGVLFRYGVDAGLGQRTINAVFAALAAGNVLDVIVREELLAIKKGDHNTRKKSKGFNLDALSQQYRAGAALDKGEDSWRLRYIELIDTPVSQWPARAIDYALEDAAATLDVALGQSPGAVPVTECEGLQTRAAWALHLAARIRGIATDANQIAKMRTMLERENEAHTEAALESGMLRWQKKKGVPYLAKDTKRIKTLALLSYVKRGEDIPLTDSGVEVWGQKKFPHHTITVEKVQEIADLIMDDEKRKELDRAWDREKARAKREGRERNLDFRPPWNGKLIPCVKTGADEIAPCVDTPFLDAIVKRDANIKILNTYLRHFDRGVHGPMLTSPQVLVETGRTSWRNSNLQNLPQRPGVRECIVARPGYVLSACDYDSLELRTLAQTLYSLFGRSSLAEKYRENPDYDPHTAFAARLMRISEEAALALKKADDPTLLAFRQRAKAANFGYPGGMGAESFRALARGYGLELSLKEAQELKEQWLRQVPEMELFFRYMGNATRGGSGAITLPLSKRTRGRCMFTAACNYTFQGSASDGGKAAMFEIARECYTMPDSPLYGSHLLIFVHDEFICEHPEEKGHEAVQRIQEIAIEQMEKHSSPYVPIRAGGHLMRRWYKKAKETYDENGRLIPWEPKAAA